MPYSPCSLLGLFHPKSASRVLPLEVLLLTRCRTPFRAPSHAFLTLSEDPSSRLCSPCESRPQQGGLDLAAANTPVGFLPPGFYRLHTLTTHHGCHPLMHLLPVSFMLLTDAVLQGFSRVDQRRSVSRPPCPHGIFHLVIQLNSAKTPASGLMVSPQSL